MLFKNIKLLLNATIGLGVNRGYTSLVTAGVMFGLGKIVCWNNRVALFALPDSIPPEMDSSFSKYKTNGFCCLSNNLTAEDEIGCFNTHELTCR